MPGKSSLSTKAKDIRESSPEKKISVAASESQLARKVLIWPEWTEAELAAEKWELLTKGKDKPKAVGSLYDDPEGLLLPCVFSVEAWKRPGDFLEAEILPVLVENEDCCELDLLSSNRHLLHNQLMCTIITDLMFLWRMREAFAHAQPELDPSGSGYWCPWQHIQPWLKGSTSPSHNPQGKYYVKLFWMGCWRKVIVDDQIPVDKEGLRLVPSSPSTRELWPLILSKGILKVASLQYCAGGKEMVGDVSVFQMLTGWICESVPIKGEPEKFWTLVTGLLPKWIRDNSDKTPQEVSSEASVKSTPHESTSHSVKNTASSSPVASHEVIVMASSSLLPTNGRVNLLSKISQENEIVHHTQQQIGLERVEPPQSVILTQWRDEPLELPPKEPPPPKLEAPYYLGLKHRKPRPGTSPTSPFQMEPHCIEIMSPFLRQEQPEEPDSPRTGSGKVKVMCVWAELQDMVKGFRSVMIFRKPSLFSEHRFTSDLPTARSSISSAGSKKTPQTSKQQQHTPSTISRAHNFLYVDSLLPIDILVVFSSLSSWRSEGGQAVGLVRKPSMGLASWLSALRMVKASTASSSDSIPNREEVEAPHNGDNVVPVTGGNDAAHHNEEGRQECGGEVSVTVSSGTDGVAEYVEDEIKEEHVVVPGVLIFKPYHWQGKYIGPPVLTICTTGTRTARLQLKPGRYIFELQIQAPLGYRVDLLSQIPFNLESEAGLLPLLSKGSERAHAHVSKVIKTILAMSEHYFNHQELKERVEKYGNKHCPRNVTKSMLQAMKISLQHVMTAHGPKISLTDYQISTWNLLLDRVFEHICKVITQDEEDEVPALDLSVLKKLGIERDDNVTGTVQPSISDVRSTANEDHSKSSKLAPLSKKKQQSLLKSDSVAVATSGHKLEEEEGDELTGGVEEQQPETAEEKLEREIMSVVETTLLALQMDSDRIGRKLYKCLFALRPDLMQKFPFLIEKSNTAFSCTYKGVFPHMDPRKWTVLFRDVIHVSEEQEMVLRLESPVHTCLVRVVDNNSGRELPREPLCHPVWFVSPTEAGYTILGEAWTFAEGVEDEGQWQLTMLTSTERLPEPSRGHDAELYTDLTTIEKCDYYLPNRDFLMLQYVVKVISTCTVTVQLNTSKSDAHFELKVLKGNEVVTSKEGCGHCVLPALFLHPQDGSSEQAGSGHYVIQAVVLRESWSVADSAWPYISMIRSLEKAASIMPVDKPTSGSGRRQSRSKAVKTPKGGSQMGRSGQNVHSAKEKEREILTNKPHWILRVIVASSDRLNVEISKDTSREEEIKNLVQAWEADQPGRSKKAQLSRQKYLESHAIHREDGIGIHDEAMSTSTNAASEGATTNSDSTLIQEFSIPVFGPVPIRTMDLTPFLVPAPADEALLVMDESLEQERERQHQEEVREFRKWQAEVAKRRSEERQARDFLKQQQLELAEQWQMQLDTLRKKLNAPREAIRERYLAKEKAKLEQEAAPIEPVTSGRESKKSKPAKGKKK